MTVHSIPGLAACCLPPSVLALGVGMADAGPWRRQLGGRGAAVQRAPARRAPRPRTAAPIGAFRHAARRQRAARRAACHGELPAASGLVSARAFSAASSGQACLACSFAAAFGGLGGLASFFGLILQAGLIVGAIMLAMRFFRNRSATAPSTGPQPAYAGRRPTAILRFSVPRCLAASDRDWQHARRCFPPGRSVSALR